MSRWYIIFYLQCAYSLRNGIYNVIHVRSIEIETETAAKSHIYQHRSNSALPCPALPCPALPCQSFQQLIQHQMGAQGEGGWFSLGNRQKGKNNWLYTYLCMYSRVWFRSEACHCSRYGVLYCTSRFHRLMAALFKNRPLISRFLALRSLVVGSTLCPYSKPLCPNAPTPQRPNAQRPHLTPRGPRL